MKFKGETRKKKLQINYRYKKYVIHRGRASLSICNLSGSLALVIDKIT